MQACERRGGCIAETKLSNEVDSLCGNVVFQLSNPNSRRTVTLNSVTIDVNCGCCERRVVGIELVVTLLVG